MTETAIDTITELDALPNSSVILVRLEDGIYPYRRCECNSLWIGTDRGHDAPRPSAWFDTDLPVTLVT